MNNQTVITDSHSNKWRSRIVLFLRLLLGGLAGIGISSWICFGLISHAIEMSPILSAPFVGYIYLFHLDTVSFQHISDFFITFPVLFLGLIGALLASGRKSYIKTGAILLGIYVVVGFVSSILSILIYIPT